MAMKNGWLALFAGLLLILPAAALALNELGGCSSSFCFNGSTGFGIGSGNGASGSFNVNTSGGVVAGNNLSSTGNSFLVWLGIIAGATETTTTTTSTTTTTQGGVSTAPTVQAVEDPTCGNCVKGRLSKVREGESSTLLIPETAKVNVKSIKITAKEIIVGMDITVRVIAEPTKAVPVTVEKIFQYIELNKTIAQGVMKEAKIEFTVTKKWISDNNINPDSIKLKRLAEGAWNDLDTIKKADGTTAITYEATTPGFSEFAIYGLPVGVTTTSTTIPGGITGEQIATTTTTLGETTTTQSAIERELGKLSPDMRTYAIVGIVIIAVAAVGFVAWKKRESKSYAYKSK